MRTPSIVLPLLIGFVSLMESTAWSQPGVYVTEFGRKILTQSDVVVRAEVMHIAPPFRGVSIGRLEVSERLSGYDRAESLTLLFIEDYVAPDAFTATLERAVVRGSGSRSTIKQETVTGPDKRRKGAGVRLAKGERGLFFLRKKGASYALVGLGCGLTEQPEGSPVLHDRLRGSGDGQQEDGQGEEASGRHRRRSLKTP